MSNEFEGKEIAPFQLFSSSLTTGYVKIISSSFMPGVDITNLHDDKYFNEIEGYIQGPFTSQHVGGHQSRHVKLNTGDQNLSNRPEAFYINFSNNNLVISSPGLISILTSETAPVARFFREPLAKSAINVQNIQTNTSSLTIGNYCKDYQVFSTTGGRINNKGFVENEGYGIGENAFLPLLNITQSYQKPVRKSSDSIFIERFSAPGDKYSMGDADGGQGLDPISAEYSPYSTVNYRNYDVRFKIPIEQSFGLRGILQKTFEVGQPNFHRIQRNQHKVIKQGLEGDITQELQIHSNAVSPAGVTEVSGTSGWTRFTNETQTGILVTNDDPQLGTYHYIMGSNIVGSKDEHRYTFPSKIGQLYELNFYVIRSEGVEPFYLTEWQGIEPIRIPIDENQISYTLNTLRFVATSSYVTMNFVLFGEQLFDNLLFLDNVSIRVVNSTYTSSNHDNGYLGRSIPASDIQYSWIETSHSSAPLGYSTSSDDLKFITGSDIHVTI